MATHTCSDTRVMITRSHLLLLQPAQDRLLGKYRQWIGVGTTVLMRWRRRGILTIDQAEGDGGLCTIQKPGFKAASLIYPVLTGGFSTTSTTWEAKYWEHSSVWTRHIPRAPWYLKEFRVCHSNYFELKTIKKEVNKQNLLSSPFGNSRKTESLDMTLKRILSAQRQHQGNLHNKPY